MALTKIDDRGLKTPIDLLDNEKIRFGTGDNLEIYRDGSNSYLLDNAGNLYLQATANNSVTIGKSGGEICIKAKPDSAVELYYDNSKKLHTFSGGVKFFGSLEADDNGKIQLGDNADLEIYHSGSDNFITADTQNLILKTTAANKGTYIQSDDHVWITTPASAEVMAKIIKDGAVELYHNNIEMFYTSASGCHVGRPSAAAHLHFLDGGIARFGTSNDLEIFHDGFHSYIKDTGTGALKLRSDQFMVLNAANDEYMIVADQNDSVKLYHNHVKKLETKEKGISIQSGQRECNITLQNDARTWKIVNYDYTDAGADNLGFHDGTADRVIIKNNGNVQIPDGDLEVASGHGIDFSAVSHAGGMTSELLDSYEEGTFTPYIRGTGGSAGSYAQFGLNGKYTKIGNMVHFTMQSVLSNKGSYSGNFKWGGLPFTAAASNYAVAINMYPSTNVDGVMRTARVNNGQDFGYVMSGSRLDIPAPYSEIVTGYYFSVAGTYQAA